MNAQPQFTPFRVVRRHQLPQGRVLDSYKLPAKLHEPSACPECGAVFHAGCWQWAARPDGAHEVICSACHRIHDHFPAGYVHLQGKFIHAHHAELLHLLRNHGRRATAEHPMERIMRIEEQADRVLVTTTDIHLARDLGDALHHAHRGTLEFHYSDTENLLRVHWKR
jgi:hypothetical protein